MLFRAVVVLGLLGLAQFAQAQSAPFSIQRLSAPITFDGHVDDPAWQTVQPLPLVVYEPTFGGEATERTLIRIAYDDEYLYAAGQLYDSDPNGIRSNSLYRDRYSGDDTFALIIDTYNDNENALWFFTNPVGVRADQTISNDGQFTQSSMPFNESWNTFWDVMTQQTDEGWFVEMRIPFSSLRFQDEAGEVRMGLSAYRFIARKNERHLFPAIEPNWFMAFIKASQLQDVTLEGVYSQKPLYITPYFLSGRARTETLNDQETAYERHNDTQLEVGLDLKYSLTSNLTLDVTANTDFAQVEADDQQVNLTRFSLFFPEKRQFFQERSSIFEFSMGGNDRLFHSRRIGLRGGETVPIIGGVRLVGRVGDWDLGFLDMQTARSGALESENFGVLRLRRQVFNENSYAGGIITSRVGLDGAYNLAYGLDGTFRVFGNDYLTFNWAQTLDKTAQDADLLTTFNSGQLRVDWQRRNNLGLHYQAGLTWSGEQFDPGIGFVLRTDFTQFSGALSYGIDAPEASKMRRFTPTLDGNIYIRNQGGGVESAFVGHNWQLQTKSGMFSFIGLRYQYEDLTSGFSLSDDADVPAGTYNFFDLFLWQNTPPGSLIRGDGFINIGQFYDGWIASGTLSPTWNVSPHLELGGTYVFNFVSFSDRDQSFRAHIFRLRLQAALNIKVSANAFVQYNTAAHQLGVNARFRYNFAEGNDLYIVYNQGVNTDLHRATPVLPRVPNRTALLKYTYTFGF